MTIHDFNEKVLRMYTGEITDLIFQYIENNRELMNDYLDLVSATNRQTVNSQLGKAIKTRFNIDNDGRGYPKSALIKTNYTKHN